MTTEALGELGRLAAEEGVFRVRTTEDSKTGHTTHTYLKPPPITFLLQSVRVLCFFDNGLGPGGATALAEALERGGFGDTLEGLYVRANQVQTDAPAGRKGKELQSNL